VQFSLPFREKPEAQAPRPLRIGTRVHLVRFVRVRRARRYVLRMRPDGTLRVAVPPFGNLGDAAAFVQSQREWIERERTKVLRAMAQQPPSEELAALRKRARRELPEQLRALATRHGFSVGRVSVRNQRTLWGSCSRRQESVSLNWRLIRMPDSVRDYILLHELAHLRHANHSRQFWKLVESMCPEYREANRWLRAHGALL
jgi:hypothetical protein